MKKVTELIEQHVQWVALGLGGIYLLWMVFAYVLQPPVTDTLGRTNEVVTPVTIEEKIAGIDSPLARLRQAMDSRETRDFVVPDYAQMVQRSMGWENVQIAALSDDRTLFDPTRVFPPIAPPVLSPTPGRTLAQGGTGNDMQAPTARLAKVPAPLPIGVSTGRSLVMMPPPPGQPVQRVMQPRPRVGQLMPAVPANAKDRAWNTPTWRLPMPEIAQALVEAEIPLQLQQTMALRLEVIREELVDGEWRNPTPVKPLANIQPMPYPKEGDLLAEEQYRVWALGRQPEILHPPYYQVVKGQPWQLPILPVADLAQRFDPRLFVGNLDQLPKEQREQVLQYRREQYQRRLAEEQNRQRSRQPGSRGRTNEAYDPGYAPIDPARPIELAQYRPPPGVLLPGADSGAFCGEPGNEDDPYGTDMGQPEEAPRPELPQAMDAGPVPNGMFQPAAWPGDINVWAVDETAQPNRTYRYKMRYYLFNPLYGTLNVAKNPEDSKVFALISPWSEPTEPVTSSGDVEYFVKSIWNDRVVLDVFKWTEGRWHRSDFTVYPGDLIGGMDLATGVDFSTGATLVIVRDSPTQAVISDETGALSRRDYGDRNKPKLQELKLQAEEADRLAGTFPVRPR